MSAEPDPDCPFCNIVAGQIPADVVHETGSTVAFRDLQPQAPTHLLVIPRAHYPNAGAMAAAEPDLAAEVLRSAATVAEQEGLHDGYRLVFNTGPGAHQTVMHVHAHVLGGRDLGWPPG